MNNSLTCLGMLYQTLLLDRGGVSSIHCNEVISMNDSLACLGMICETLLLDSG